MFAQEKIRKKKRPNISAFKRDRNILVFLALSI
jgi:hypothetical protein